MDAAAASARTFMECGNGVAVFGRWDVFRLEFDVSGWGAAAGDGRACGFDGGCEATTVAVDSG